MPRSMTLSDLFVELFSEDELFDWLRRLPGSVELRSFLPTGKPMFVLATETEALLRRHGLIDGALFDSLVQARPGHALAIQALAADRGHTSSGSVDLTPAAQSTMIFMAPLHVTGGHVGPGNHVTINVVSDGSDARGEP